MRPSVGDFVVTIVKRQGVTDVTIASDEATVDRSRHDAGWSETLRRLRGYITSRIGDPEAAADIAQDVIARSIAAGALERAHDLNGWLFRAAQNAIVDHYRSHRTPHRSDDDLDRWAEPEPDDRAPNRATRDLARCVQPLIDELPAKYRDALTAVDIEGRTHHQAAAEAGISTSGMKSRVQRGRRHLRDLLSECCAVNLDRDGAISSYRSNGTSKDGAVCGCATDTSTR
jgi:RNA polymerase sigma-70 factor (ECF subfamily)